MSSSGRTTRAFGQLYPCPTTRRPTMGGLVLPIAGDEGCRRGRGFVLWCKVGAWSVAGLMALWLALGRAPPSPTLALHRPGPLTAGVPRTTAVARPRAHAPQPRRPLRPPHMARADGAMRYVAPGRPPAVDTPQATDAPARAGRWACLAGAAATVVFAVLLVSRRRTPAWRAAFAAPVCEGGRAGPRERRRLPNRRDPPRPRSAGPPEATPDPALDQTFNFFCLGPGFERGLIPKEVPLDAVVVPVSEARNLVRRGPREAEAVLLRLPDVACIPDWEARCIWLGAWGATGEAFVALMVPGTHAAAVAAAHGAEWASLRDVAGELPTEREAAVLSLARGMAAWSAGVPHCSRCGAPTAPHRLGTQRRCTAAACGARQRPRIDPSVIMLVADEDRCLLGRKAAWEPGRYSTLAGFVELGESLEETVLREVREESGVLVDLGTLRFHSTQPWLFPRSLMVGFHVRPHAASPPVAVNTDELEDVRWFDRRFVARYLRALEADGVDPAAAREFHLPGPGGGGGAGFHIPGRASLAFSLISSWALGE